MLTRKQSIWNVPYNVFLPHFLVSKQSVLPDPSSFSGSVKQLLAAVNESSFFGRPVIEWLGERDLQDFAEKNPGKLSIEPLRIALEAGTLKCTSSCSCPNYSLHCHFFQAVRGAADNLPLNPEADYLSKDLESPAKKKSHALPTSDVPT